MAALGTSGTLSETLALSVHGPGGVLDLVVPAGASGSDVALEYAREAGLGVVPRLHTTTGRVIDPARPLTEERVVSGQLLVAALGGPGPAVSGAGRTDEAPETAGPVSGLVIAVAAAAAVLSGWFAAHVDSFLLHTITVDLLAVGAILGVLPVGRYAAQRALAAPAFAAAGAYAIVWEPGAVELPMALGIAGLAAAVTAAIARTLADERDDALTVVMITGAGIFLAAGVWAVAGFSPPLLWSVLLVTAMLAARFIPSFAIDVPDQVLLDLERLAVTAWSARDRPRGRRGRMLVTTPTITALVRRGSRIVTAGAAAVFVVTVLSATQLLATALVEVDQNGARCLVFFAGGALLFAARSYRHRSARLLLRLAGLACWLVLTIELLRHAKSGQATLVVVTSLFLGAIMVAAAVATGRGWRSVWWARRAEIGEGICGAFAVAAIFVSSGIVRTLWEISSERFG
ncbi:hypothetical protein [Nocardioides speluncae]|uniref:hypothetical protein n=1 Tax=Nocardioides speluncae TaxID=2670337 RepID=UPI000D6861DA|nr:hypothetical protein [Nocardioides speluncae]